MANLCFNSTTLVGDVNTLRTIADIVSSVIKDAEEKIVKPEYTYEELQKRLGFECDEWGRSYDEGLYNVNVDNLDNGYIILNGITAWGSIPEYWDSLCEKFNLQYVDLVELDEAIAVINDPEHLFVNYDYVLELDTQEGLEFFNSDEDALYFTEKEFSELVSNIEEFDNLLEVTVGDFNIFLDENDFGRLVIVDRFGEQVYPQAINKDMEDYETEDYETH